MVGARIDDTGSGRPASRAVDCGLTVADLYAGYSESNTADDTIACISSPNQAATRASLDAPLIDFGVVGTTVQAPAGSSVTATFLAKRSGAPDARHELRALGHRRAARRQRQARPHERLARR